MGEALVPLDEAQARVLDAVPLLPARLVARADAGGLVLAETVVAGEPVPPFANTAMDGYAVRAADTTAAPVRLQVVGTVAAGAVATTPLDAGQAYRIMTGAPIPPGADAVVMVERTTAEDDGAVVVVEAAAGEGQFIRPAGDDIRAGQEVFAAGTVLTAGAIGVLSSIGVTEVRTRVPHVALLSTGDELVEGDALLGPGQIRESNRPALALLLRQAGCLVDDIGIVADTEAATIEALDAAIAGHEAVVTSGGVSMGEFDYVKRYLSTWMQVAIKPAKPFAFGVVDGTPVFGLPGNPVSSLVSFELFVRPALRKMMGFAPDQVHRPRRTAICDEAFSRKPDGKLHLNRAVVEWRDGAYHVRSAGQQGSHQLHAMAAANALALLPDGVGARVGETVEVMLLGDH